MTTKLPGWAVDDITSVRQEAEPYRAMTPEARGRRLRRVCRTAARIARSREDAAAVFAWRDPVPESTLLHLARLRALLGKGQPR